MKKGICYLIGAGPGDPGLLTLKGLACLKKAEVIVYDALISPEIHRFFPLDAKLIDAGKRAKDHTLTQAEINQILVDEVSKDQVVIRLKGGDPLIFGRGGEEAQELANAGLPFEWVPGISSALAAPAYAGIPVTHRQQVAQLTIFTGHEDPTKTENQLDYHQLAKPQGGRIFLMGISRLDQICHKLIEAGASKGEPIALIRWATTPRQQTLVGTLSTIAELARLEDFKSPAVAFIGEVVNYRNQLNWFETRKLFGQRIVITRTRKQSSQLKQQLENVGAEVLELPLLEVQPAKDQVALKEAVEYAYTYDWLVFTSPNGVEHFFEVFFQCFKDARCLGMTKIACVGPGTAKKLAEYRFKADLMPVEKYVAEGLVEAFKAESIENQTVLYAKAETTRDVLVKGLNQQLAIVDECIAYKTVAQKNKTNETWQTWNQEEVDWIVFASTSAVKAFVALELTLLEETRIISFGPITSEALRSEGYEIDIEIKTPSIPNLVEELVEIVEKEGKEF